MKTGREGFISLISTFSISESQDLFFQKLTFLQFTLGFKVFLRLFFTNFKAKEINNNSGSCKFFRQSNMQHQKQKEKRFCNLKSIENSAPMCQNHALWGCYENFRNHDSLHWHFTENTIRRITFFTKFMIRAESPFLQN